MQVDCDVMGKVRRGRRWIIHHIGSAHRLGSWKVREASTVASCGGRHWQQGVLYLHFRSLMPCSMTCANTTAPFCSQASFSSHVTQIEKMSTAAARAFH